ncbi:MAG: ribosome maturation factor RimP [Clostridiales bacterium]|nr:ribosome maturation factor RimP [Clostridiales bacterium]
MKESVVDRAYEVIEPICVELGYHLVEVTYKKEVGGMTLWVCIDKDGGIDINDCERLSRALDEPLDDKDITNGSAYNLNITSYGLDRAFKTDYDFNKHLMQEIVIKFYKPWMGKKEIRAILLKYNKDAITIKYNDTDYDLQIKDTALIQKYIEF